MMNLSIYAIPVYYILSLVPHSYGLNLIMSTKNGRWDNANPRSPKTQAAAEKSVPAATFARYERAEAAHQNCMETMPLFASAVILGNLAQLPVATLNVFAGSYLLLRVAYVVAYINISTHKASRIRSGIWATSSILLLYQIVVAGNVLARKHGS